MKANFDFSLSPKEAIAYLKNKELRVSFNYDEIMHEAHHTAFTVAKVMRDDLLMDIRDSIAKALEDGIPFSEWKKSLKPTLKSYGWWGETEVENPKTGEIKTIHVGSRRLKTIFYTNMRVAYSVGRYKQMKALPLSTYWRYNSMRLPTSRDTHKAKHGIVKHRDDPWWQTNYPPNAWNCVCYVTAHRKREVEKRGWKITEHPIENIASKDWAYDVGAGTRVGKLEKIDLDKSLEKLPQLFPDESKKDISEEKLKKLFYTALGVKEGDLFIDKTGNALLVDDRLFRYGDGKSKIKSRKERKLVFQKFADTLKDPDEVYLEIEHEGEPTGKSGKKKKKYRISKKFFKYYMDEKGRKMAIVAIFHFTDDKTVGSSIHLLTPAQVEKRRKDFLIFQKGRK